MKTPTTKTCGRCKKRKRINQFWVRSDNGNPRNTCKDCQSKQAKLNRKNKK